MSNSSERLFKRCGLAMRIIAILLFLSGVAFYASRSYTLSHWARTEGRVVSAQLTREWSTNNNMLCGAAYQVAYQVSSVTYTLAARSTSSSTNCAAWERKVAEMPGSAQTIIYDPARPASSLADLIWWQQYLAAIILVPMGIFFFLMSFVFKILAPGAAAGPGQPPA